MKQKTLFAAIIAASLTMSGCIMPGTAGTGTSTGTQTTSATSDVLGAVLGSLLGQILTSSLTEQSIVGTWTYQQPDVRFESENLLAKAGGEVAAASIEQKLNSYLTKVGISKGVTTYTFNQDKTFSISTGGKVIASGTYTFDANSKKLKMQGSLGIFNQTCTAGMDGTSLCLLYDANKLLTMANTVGSTLGKASNNATVSSITALLGSNYKGMKLGFQLSK
jgi:hypothetical protein